MPSAAKILASQLEMLKAFDKAGHQVFCGTDRTDLTDAFKKLAYEIILKDPTSFTKTELERTNTQPAVHKLKLIAALRNPEQLVNVHMAIQFGIPENEHFQQLLQSAYDTQDEKTRTKLLTDFGHLHARASIMRNLFDLLMQRNTPGVVVT